MDAPIFTQAFNSFAGHGDKITAEHDGFKLVATIHADDNSDAPWKRDDGHGPVSDWRAKDSKRAGERILNQDGGKARFYDFAKACKIALRDGWGYDGKSLDQRVQEGMTRRQAAAAAAEHDFKVLKAWCDDEWSYCGIAVTVSRHGVQLVGKYDSALWGIELNYPGAKNAYLAEVAEEQAADALTIAKSKLTELCRIPRGTRLLAPSRARVQAAKAALATLAARRRPATPTASQGA